MVQNEFASLGEGGTKREIKKVNETKRPGKAEQT